MLPLSGSAVPRVGGRLPAFQAHDLTDRLRSSRELAGRPTLAVVLTGSDAGDATHAWLTHAYRRYSNTNVRVVNLLALDLPFFVSEDYARSVARERVSQGRWRETWLEGDGRMQAALGMEDGSRHPYVVALDPRGHVVASVHGPFTPQSAATIAAALGGP